MVFPPIVWIRNEVACLATPCSDAASKHATQAYFDCLRAEIEHFGIPVTVISPGYIRTNLSVNAVTGDGSKHGGNNFAVIFEEFVKLLILMCN